MINVSDVNHAYFPIKNYPNYEISATGQVRNRNTGRLLKQFIKESKGGSYKGVFLYNADGRRMLLVHRLVAETFIPNPEHLPQVNHIDENSLNNKAENLEWCTAKYNVNYGNHNRRRRESLLRSGKGWQGRKHREDSKRKMSVAKLGKPSLRKKAVIINNEIVMPSLTECAAFLNISLTQVYNLLNGNRHSETISLKYMEEGKCMNA